MTRLEILEELKEIVVEVREYVDDDGILVQMENEEIYEVVSKLNEVVDKLHEYDT